jgi:transcriptional regulator with XRE-family HTH domain
MFSVPSQATEHLKARVAMNIDVAIRARKLTNRAVAEAIGSTEHQVWRWRRGRVTPGPANIAALATLLADGDASVLYAEPAQAAA